MYNTVTKGQGGEREQRFFFFPVQFLDFPLDDKAVLNTRQSVPGKLLCIMLGVVSDPKCLV